MRRKIHKCLSFLLAAVRLASLAAPAALAAEGGDTVFVRTAEDLVQLAENCTLDSWSQGKTVVLTDDINLSGSGFTPIPTFGGTFDGQGHTISGLTITGSGNTRGLFRYVQQGALVRDMTVKGRIKPGGTRASVGGIAGSNAGTIENCALDGVVSGTSQIGGIAGVNTVKGSINGCTVSGTVYGSHCGGGVVGQNDGVAANCTNVASVNTTVSQNEVKLNDLTLDNVLKAEKANDVTDAGGIAGNNAGVLRACINRGTIGYSHIGYNVGGIAGSQTGVYPIASPGGWQLIGRTPVRMYDPHRAVPILPKAGQYIHFYPIDQAEYDRIAAREAGEGYTCRCHYREEGAQ